MFSKKVQYYLGKYKIHKLGIDERGIYKNNLYDHILPKEYKELNFIGNTYSDVLNLENKIKFHSITNLKSSQVLCLNLFIPFMNEKYKHILINILNKYNIINTKSKIVDFVFEKEYVLEGKTCFDLYLKLEDTTQVFFELKYTEEGFGKYSKTKTDVIETYYKNLFKESLNLCKYDLDNKANIKFFEENYQLFRNVGFVRNDKDHCVFIYPFKNDKCSSEINNFFQHNDSMRNIHTIDLEELVNCILEEVENTELIHYYTEFKMKYLNYEITGFDVIDDTDVNYDYKENINKVIINCFKNKPIHPKGLYTLQKKEYMESMIDYMFLRIESLHDINDFLNMINGNATSRLFFCRITEEDILEDYIEDRYFDNNALLYVSCEQQDKINKIIEQFSNCNTATSNITKNLVFAAMYSKKEYSDYSNSLSRVFGTMDNTDEVKKYINSGLDDKYFVFNTNTIPSIMYSAYKVNHRLDINSFVLFDIETSGLNKHRDEILKIEAYKVTAGIYESSFKRVIKPKSKVSEVIKEITNITEEELNKGIDLDIALKEFFEYTSGSILLSSNLSFDFELLFNNIEQYNKDIINVLMNNTFKILSLDKIINIEDGNNDLYSKVQQLIEVISNLWCIEHNITTLNINLNQYKSNSKLYYEFIKNYNKEIISYLRGFNEYEFMHNKKELTLEEVLNDIEYFKENKKNFDNNIIDEILLIHEVAKNMILNHSNVFATYFLGHMVPSQSLTLKQVEYDNMLFELKKDLTATFIEPLHFVEVLEIPHVINVDNKVYVVDSINHYSCNNVPKKIILPYTIKSINVINYLEDIELLGNSYYIIMDKILYSKDKRELISYPINKKDTTLKISDEVVKVIIYSEYLKHLIVGKKVLEINIVLPKLNKIEVHKDNKFLSSLDGVLYTKDFTKIIHFPVEYQKESFKILDSVKSIYGQIYNSNIKELYIGKSLVYENTLPVSSSSLENITVSPNNTHFYSENGILYSKDRRFLIDYPSKKKDKTYKVPDWVEFIDICTLMNDNLEQIILNDDLEIDEDGIYCGNLKSIIIKKNNNEVNNKLMLIDDVLYETNDLTVIATCNKNYIKIIEGVECINSLINTKKLELPSTLKEIDSHILCVEEFIVSDDNKYFCSIDGVLYSKDKKTLVCYPCSKKDKLFVVPDFVEKIDCTFMNTKVEELVIGNNVCEFEMVKYSLSNCKRITLPIKFKKQIEKISTSENIEIIYID